MQVRTHHRLHRLDIQHAAGLEVDPRRQHRQGAEHRLQTVRGMDEGQDVEALTLQTQ